MGKTLLKSRFREKRFKRFLELFQIQPSTRILDVGGLPETWRGTGLENNVTILNISPPPPSQAESIRWVQCDTCSMKCIEDRAFDIVFSNSVIEHVGGIKRQRQMANEVRRVGKGYWIQTPYKHFPIEIHFLFPFFQYCPRKVRHLIATLWPFSFPKKLHLDPIDQADSIWLLDQRSFCSLFPDSCLLVEHFCGLKKSLVAAKWR